MHTKEETEIELVKREENPKDIVKMERVVFKIEKKSMAVMCMLPVTIRQRKGCMLVCGTRYRNCFGCFAVLSI